MTNRPLFYCPWKNCELPAAVAGLCDYVDSETYICRHSGEDCVARDGLEQSAQSLEDFTRTIPLDAFEKMRECIERERRPKIYAEIAKLADHICGPPKTPPKDEG